MTTVDNNTFTGPNTGIAGGYVPLTTIESIKIDADLNLIQDDLDYHLSILQAIYNKLDLVESGATDDQTAVEITALINASASLIDADNLEATVALLSNIISDIESHRITTTQGEMHIETSIKSTDQTYSFTPSTVVTSCQNILDEINNLRIQIHKIVGKTTWIDTPDATLAIIKSKLDTIESGATSDQGASEIMTLLNASAQILDDNNIASTIARDTEVTSSISTHSSNANAHHAQAHSHTHASTTSRTANDHHSSTSDGMTITPYKVQSNYIQSKAGGTFYFKNSANSSKIALADGATDALISLHLTPNTDNAYDIGTSTKRWALIRGVVITSGDLGFEETTCPRCGKSFETGDILVLVVKTLHEYGTLTIPMHLKCVDLSPVEISLPVPQMRDEWAMEGELLKIIQVPDTEMKTKTVLKIRPDVILKNGKTIIHHPILDIKTGKFKLKGNPISKNQATQLVDETSEVPIYKDVKIMI